MAFVQAGLLSEDFHDQALSAIETRTRAIEDFFDLTGFKYVLFFLARFI